MSHSLLLFSASVFSLAPLCPYSLPSPSPFRHPIDSDCEAEVKQTSSTHTGLNEMGCLGDRGTDLRSLALAERDWGKLRGWLWCVFAFETLPLGPLAGEDWLLSGLIGTPTNSPSLACSAHLPATLPPSFLALQRWVSSGSTTAE